MPASSAVTVCVRTRPTASFAQDNIVVQDNQVSVRMPRADVPNAQDSWSWKYDAVLHNASQETVYVERVAPIVQSVLGGYNGTVMCYGQTGSGKTFTQIGSLESFQNRGITPRAVADIFAYVSDHPQYEATISVSYVEIYQDQLIDLLSTLPTAEPITEPLALVEDKRGECHVKNLRLVPAASEEEALGILFEGQTNRQIANHQLNRNSTRGHAIFTVHLRLRSRVDSSGVVTRCKLNLVDLAGSERLKKTETMGDLRAESMYINKSLTYLEQVVVALSSKGRAHTPYRQSKLTHLLKDSLGGNCKTLLIANVYGERQHLEETISTLQFAARVRLVPNEATLNTEHDPATLLKKYALEIADLKRELAMHDALASRSRVAYEPYSDAQRLALMEELQAYLAGEDDAHAEGMELESVRQMRELLSAMKTLYGRQAAELTKAQQMLASGEFVAGAGAGGGGGEGGAGAGGGDDGGAGGDGVGEGDPNSKRGIAIGHAADGAKPPGGLVEPPAYQRSFTGSGEEDEGAVSFTQSAVQDVGSLGRDEAYVQYKLTEGADINERLLAAKRSMKEAKAKRVELAAAVNGAKREIDQIKGRIEQKKAERQAQASSTLEEAEIIDEEEYAFIQELKSAKKAYKTSHEAMQQAADTVASASAIVDEARTELLTTFNEWYAAVHNEQPEPLVPRPSEDLPPSADKMDDDEQFEQLQMARVMAEEPESLAFVRARKSMLQKSNRRKK